MINSGFTPRLLVVRPKFEFLVRSKFFFCLIFAALLGVLSVSAQTEQLNPDEEYIRIMAMIDKADAAREAGQIPLAVTKYRQAQTNLVWFKATNPMFDPKTVKYRLDEVSGRIDALTAPPERTNASGTSAEAEPAAPAPKSPVKLIDAGSEPRKVLRFHGQAGDTQTTLMVVKSTVDTGAQGATPIVTPAMTLPLDITTKSVAANGDITYEIALGEVTVAEDTNANAQAAQGMKTIVSAIKGVTITGVMSDRGISKKTDVKAPPGSSPQLQQVVEQLKEGFMTMDSPLPDEAVGAGAKWEIQRPVKVQGLAGQQTESYQLVSFDATHLNTSMTINVAATNQMMQTITTTTGTNSTDLAKIAPLTGFWTTHSEINASGPKPMAVKTDTSIEMESK